MWHTMQPLAEISIVYTSDIIRWPYMHEYLHIAQPQDIMYHPKLYIVGACLVYMYNQEAVIHSKERPLLLMHSNVILYI